MPHFYKKEEHWTGWWIRLDKIHETQLDNQKVKEVIMEVLGLPEDDEYDFMYDKLKEKLGLE